MAFELVLRGIQFPLIFRILLFTEEEEAVDDAGVENGGMGTESDELRLHTEMDESNFMPSEANKSR